MRSYQCLVCFQHSTGFRLNLWATQSDTLDISDELIAHNSIRTKRAMLYLLSLTCLYIHFPQTLIKWSYSLWWLHLCGRGNLSSVVAAVLGSLCIFVWHVCVHLLMFLCVLQTVIRELRRAATTWTKASRIHSQAENHLLVSPSVRIYLKYTHQPNLPAFSQCRAAQKTILHF